MSSFTAEKSKTVAPYGAWKSPITADLLTQKNVRLGEIAVTRTSGSSAEIVFVENRPQEGGRAALVKRTIDLATLSPNESKNEIDLTKEKYNARSGVHEYGGGSMASSGDDKLLFTDYNTFAVFEVKGEEEPKKLTADNKAHRFADFRAHPTHPFFVSILEDHTIDKPADVVNTIVCVDKRNSLVQTLVSGSDFYSNPRISPDGRLLAWVSWNHPSMPFFATELWVAELIIDADSKEARILNEKLLGTKGADEVVQSPVWADDSTLIFSSDRTGYANLYKVTVNIDNGLHLSTPKTIYHAPIKSEFNAPAWTLNNSNYVVLDKGWLACNVINKAVSSLALFNIESGELKMLKSPFVVLEQLRALGPTAIVFEGGQSNETDAIIAMDLSDAIQGFTDTPRWQVIKRSSNVVEKGVVPRDYLSKAEVIEFPTELPNGEQSTAHAIILPPCNPDYMAPAGTSPPCIVKIHGGPTSAANAALNLTYNYWTSRGYMICIVNYGGSTGYGREFMLRLDGQWGVVDVRDAVAAATYLGSSHHGETNRNKKALRRISSQAQRELERLKERTQPSGAKEFTLDNPISWSLGVNDVILAATLSASAALIPGIEVYHGLAAAGLAWLYSKMTHVQQETVTAIPTVGLQLSTIRGFTLPRFFSSQSSSREDVENDRFYTTSTQTKLIPRDCILDVFANEAFRRWSVIDYIAVATRKPPGSKSTSRGNRLDVLFPNLLPRLPVVEHVYRSIYPAIFGHEVPVTVSSSQQSGDVEKHGSSVSSLPLADPNKIVISGGSAGGYTVLASLCLYPRAFSAGCSSYGVSDVAALDAESHKFESRYTERLMGGNPTQIPKIYHDRSPIYMADKIKSPVLFLQGDIDKVVPPEQSESMYKILQDGGIKTKYVLFEGEGHGFRKAANIKRALEEEEAWYRSCFDIKVE